MGNFNMQNIQEVPKKKKTKYSINYKMEILF